MTDLVIPSECEESFALAFSLSAGDLKIMNQFVVCVINSFSYIQ